MENVVQLNKVLKKPKRPVQAVRLAVSPVAGSPKVVTLRATKETSGGDEDSDDYGEDNRLFGRYNISLVRELLDLSMTELALALDVNYHTWKSYESGRRRLPDNLKEELEDYVQAEVAWIMKCS